jgi:hypothetical protein
MAIIAGLRARYCSSSNGFMLAFMQQDQNSQVSLVTISTGDI